MIFDLLRKQAHELVALFLSGQVQCGCAFFGSARGVGAGGEKRAGCLDGAHSASDMKCCHAIGLQGVLSVLGVGGEVFLHKQLVLLARGAASEDEHVFVAQNVDVHLEAVFHVQSQRALK